MANIFKVFSFILLICSVSAVNYQKALRPIDDAYPFRRYYSNAIPAFFGGLATYRAGTILSDHHSAADNRIAVPILAIGVTQLSWSMYRLFSPNKAERMLGRAFSSKKDFQRALSISVDSAFWVRILKAGFNVSLAGNYLSLYVHDSEKYDSFIFSGLILALVAVMNLFFKTPEERLWQNLEQEGWSLSLTQKNSMNGLGLNFYF